MNNHYYARLKSGQALVELATLGTILLFCLGVFIKYGLQASYTQSIMMKGFRKTMKQAFFNTYTGANSGVSLTTIKDKRMIDPADKYGLAERTPFQSQSSVTWGDSLNKDTVYGDSIYLPAKAYNINDNTSTLFAQGGVTVIPSRSLTFNTADFKEYPCSCDPANPAASPVIKAHEIDYGVAPGPTAVFWTEHLVSCCEIYVDNVKNIAKYRDVAGEISTLYQADFDDDGFSETVVEVTGNPGELVQTFRAVDAQEGELDNTSVENVHTIQDYHANQQGLLSGLHQILQQTGSIAKEETPTQTITTTHVSTVGSVIGRDFKTNKDLVTGNKVINTYGTGSTPLYDKTYTWTTPK